MIRDLTDDGRTILLLELTRRLIAYSSPTKYIKTLEPEPSYEEAKKSYNEEFRNYQPHHDYPKNSPPKKIQKPLNKPEPVKKKPLKREDLEVPEPKLPPQYSHLEPNPKKIDLDLGKLNPLLNDPAVKTIEVQGPEKKVRVRGDMGDMPTEIVLNESEISDNIQTIADKSNMPIEIGSNKIELGKFDIRINNPKEGDQQITINKSLPGKNRPIKSNKQRLMPPK